MPVVDGLGFPFDVSKCIMIEEKSYREEQSAMAALV